MKAFYTLEKLKMYKLTEIQTLHCKTILAASFFVVESNKLFYSHLKLTLDISQTDFVQQQKKIKPA